MHSVIISSATGGPVIQREHKLASRGIEMLERMWLQLGIQYLFCGIVCYASADWISHDDWWAHGIYCGTTFGLLLLAGLAYWRALAENFDRVLFDLRFACIGGCLLFYFIGPTFLFFADDVALYRVAARRPLDAALALRVDAINCLGLGLALVAYRITRPVLLESLARQATRSVHRVFGNGMSLIVALLCVGAIARTTELHSAWYQGDQVANLVRVAAKSIYGALLLIGVYTGPKQGWLLGMGLAVAIADGMGGVLNADKADALMPIMALGVGLAVRKRSLVVAAALVAGALIGVQVLGAPVAYMRSIAWHDSSGRKFGIEERFDLLRQGFKATSAARAQQYRAWSRISYVHSQGQAISFYDRGDGGDDFFKIPYIFVPRFLYPEKPAFTTGVDFYYKIAGRYGSSEAMGVFVEGYYNAGLAGAVFAGIAVGVVLKQLAAACQVVVTSRTTLMYPIVLLSGLLAFRVDSHLVSGVLGPFVIICGLLGVISVGASILDPRN